MAHLSVVADDIDLKNPVLVEGFPGVGLVGKIAADHLVDALSLTHYANVHCEALPSVAVYDEGTSELASPVRLYASDDGELLVLQSDVPIEPEAAEEFAECFTPWLEDNTIPIFLAGIPTKEREDPPELYGVHAGDGKKHVEKAGLDTPTERGVIQGPAGALLAHAVEHDLTAVGLLVEADPRFPDPTASMAILERGVEPITGLDVSVGVLESHAAQIQQAKDRLAKKMQNAEETSSEAKPLRMFQ